MTTRNDNAMKKMKYLREDSRANVVLVKKIFSRYLLGASLIHSCVVNKKPKIWMGGQIR